ncbi:MAG: hypothetical protein C4576_29300 [Desulfobacteraceae bacterium]|nr:MAG: hypothetical protein C4576_29300 [Desulfobacteraceae bacterium]
MNEHLPMKPDPVGLVERSETHRNQGLPLQMGFASLNPSYKSGEGRGRLLRTSFRMTISRDFIYAPPDEQADP